MTFSREPFDGITASAPVAAMTARNRSEAKPLSAQSFSKSKPSINVSACLLSCAWPPAPLFCARGMLVRADDGGIEHEIFEVRTITQRIEDTIPYAFLGPSSETLERTVPVAEFIGQIAPRCSSPCDPQNGIDEQTIVLAVPPLVTFFTRTIPLNPRPMRVRQFPPNQARLPPVASLNHICESVGIP